MADRLNKNILDADSADYTDLIINHRLTQTRADPPSLKLPPSPRLWRDKMAREAGLTGFFLIEAEGLFNIPTQWEFKIYES